MRCGFSGSRRLRSAPFLPGLLASLPEAAEKGVGDAEGFDALVRALCPEALEFRPRFAGRGAFAARSAELVRWVAEGGEGSCFFVAVDRECPVGVRPSRSFAGKGSGSWGSAAYARGRGLRVFVFWCGEGSAPAFPAWVESGVFL